MLLCTPIMIRLSNGHSFEYVASGGSLGFAGRGWPWEHPLRWLGLLDSRLFTVVTKTLTKKSRKGNLNLLHPWTCIRLVPGGTVNSVALTNHGLDWWIKKIGPTISRQRGALVCSIFGDTAAEVAEMAGQLNSVDLVAVEINASCPNVSGSDLQRDPQAVIDACHLAKKVCRHPLLLKLSVLHDVERIIPAVADCIEALDINLVPWAMVYPDKISPLAHLGSGGVSGRAAQPYNWDLVKRMVATRKIPVIGPGVWEYRDIARIRALGASAISFGSIFLRYPWRPTNYIRRDQREHIVNRA